MELYKVDKMPSFIKPSMVDGLIELIQERVDLATANLSDQVAELLPSSSYTATDVLAKIKTVDGVGSGLDGDSLAGSSYENYLRFRGELADTENFNDLNTAGIWHQGSNAQSSLARNYPIALAGMLTVKKFSNSYVYQEYQTYENTYTFQRTWYNGTWYPWKRIIDGSRPMFSANGPGPGYDSVNRYLALAYTRINWNSMYNTSNGIAVIPQAGIWRIHYSGLNTSGYPAHTQLFINGTARTYSHSNYTGYSMDIIEWLGPLAVGDQVRIMVPGGYGVYTGDGSTAGYNRFWGVLES